MVMSRDDLSLLYRAYIDCLNARTLDQLGDFVDPDVEYNGKHISLNGYQAMLKGDFEAIPDLRFTIALLICDPPVIASRLDFDCTPVGTLFGIAVNGRRVQFRENVFYEIEARRIRRVWSVIDEAAIARQLNEKL
jgi:predicted ester cyclase